MSCFTWNALTEHRFFTWNAPQFMLFHVKQLAYRQISLLHLRRFWGNSIWLASLPSQIKKVESEKLPRQSIWAHPSLRQNSGH